MFRSLFVSRRFSRPQIFYLTPRLSSSILKASIGQLFSYQMKCVYYHI